jgi:hypothetical protein
MLAYKTEWNTHIKENECYREMIKTGFIKNHAQCTSLKKKEWVIDIIAVLLEEKDYKKAKSYWSTLKARLKKEGSELVTNCDQLKMKAQDG